MPSVWKSIVVLMVVATVGRVGAQQQLQDCIQQLLPALSGCLDAVTSPTTKPSADCCKGVSDVVKNQIKCLCALYNSPSTVASFGINMTRVLEIPVLCKVPADISVCKTNGSSTHTAPSPSPTTAKSAPSPSPTTAKSAPPPSSSSTTGGTSGPSPSPTTPKSAPSPSPTTPKSAPSPSPTTAKSAPPPSSSSTTDGTSGPSPSPTTAKSAHSPSPTTAKSAPPPSSSSAPDGTSGSEKQKNGALRLTWSLMPLWGIGLLWASLVLIP